jgi:hypothetical protein
MGGYFDDCMEIYFVYFTDRNAQALISKDFVDRLPKVSAFEILMAMNARPSMSH